MHYTKANTVNAQRKPTLAELRFQDTNQHALVGNVAFREAL